MLLKFQAVVYFNLLILLDSHSGPLLKLEVSMSYAVAGVIPAVLISQMDKTAAELAYYGCILDAYRKHKSTVKVVVLENSSTKTKQLCTFIPCCYAKGPNSPIYDKLWLAARRLSAASDRFDKELEECNGIAKVYGVPQ